MCGKPKAGPVAWQEQPLLQLTETERRQEELKRSLHEQLLSPLLSSLENNDAIPKDGEHAAEDAAQASPPGHPHAQPSGAPSAAPPAHAAARMAAPRGASPSPRPHSARAKPSVPPRFVEPRPQSPRQDFIKRNAMEAKLTQRRSSYASPATPRRALPCRGPSHGRLPAYLIDRKLELAATAARAEEEARPKECPAGHHVLPDEDRLRVLGAVRASMSRVHDELDAFPFVVDTPGQRRRQDDLCRQLAKLEAAEKLFSRRKVIVADDDGLADLDAVLCRAR